MHITGTDAYSSLDLLVLDSHRTNYNIYCKLYCVLLLLLIVIIIITAIDNNEVNVSLLQRHRDNPLLLTLGMRAV